MIVVLKGGSGKGEIEKVKSIAESMGLKTNVSQGRERTVIGIIGDGRYEAKERFESLSCVEKVIRVLKPYKLVSKEFHAEDTVVDVDGIPVGDGFFTVMAGPCSVESEEQIHRIAAFLSGLGVKILRGGAFKPRTSPYSFQGLGERGLKYLRDAAESHGMKVVTEVMNIQAIELVSEYAHILQVGTRNMQNFPLLKALGSTNKPILLKRGFMSTIEEMLLAAEYIATSGNKNIILCERGIRTFETMTRNTLDLSAVPLVRELSHLPICVDLSHSTGRREIIPPLAKAALVAGAHGIMVEVHPIPEKALSDGRQSMDFTQFESMMESLRKIAAVEGAKLPEGAVVQ